MIKRHIITRSVIALAGIAVIVESSSAQVRTSVTSGNWNTPSTWDCNCVPANNEDAVIASGNTVALNNNTTINNLTVNSGGTLDNGGKKITVNGNYHIDGTHNGKGDIKLNGTGTTISGTGSVPKCKKVFVNGNKTVLPGTDLSFLKADFRINGAFTIVNKGKVTIEKKLIGNNGNSTWVNDTDAVLNAGRDVLNTGKLIASAPGNTVHYYRNKDQNLKNPVAATYWHLKISGGGVKFLQANTIIKGDVQIQYCALDPNGNNINIEGNWNDLYGSFIEGTQRVTFNGSADQSVTATYGEGFWDLSVNKTGGSLLINNNDTVANTLTMTAGNIVTASGMLTLGTSILNPGSLVHTSGTVVGKLERWLTNTATTYLFTVGTGADYRPANLFFNALTGGSLIIQFVETFPGNNGLPLLDNPDSLFNTFSEGYWDVQSPNTLASSDYDLDLTGNGFTSFSINPSTRILTRANSSSSWTANGNHQAAANPVAYRNNLNMLPAQFAFADTASCQSYPSTSPITGPDSVCVNDAAVNYSVTPTSGSTYTWTIVGGSQASGGNTNAITVNWGSTGMTGSVTVQEYSGCAYGTPVALSVDIHALPTSPISGKSAVAANDTTVYSVSARPGYTYTWSVSGGTIIAGQGTDSITVAWGVAGTGQVSVTGSTGCGSAPAVVLTVNIYDVINSIATGNWNAAGTWDCGCTPNASSNVRINPGHTVTLTGKADAYHLEIKANGFLVDGGNKMRINGDFTLNGTYQGNNRLEIRGTSNTIDGTGNMVGFTGEMRLKDGVKTFPATANLYMPSSDVMVDKNTIAINYGQLQIGGDLLGKDAATSKWINETSSLLSVGKTLLTLGKLQASASSNTVSYNGLFNQNIKTPVGAVYYNLNIAGGSTKTMTNALDVNGDITISSTLASANFDINLAGNWTNTGVFTAGTDLVTFDGSSLQLIKNATGETFYDLTTDPSSSMRIPPVSIVTVSSTLTNNGTIDNDGILYLPNGYTNQPGTLKGSGNHVLTNGDWINTGNFLPDSGTVTFQGTLMQSIQGPTTFYNLDVNNTSGVNIASGTHNLLNTMTLISGTFNTNNALTLISDANGTGEIAAIPIGSADIVGDITVQRYIKPGPYGWRFLSSPVSGRTLADWNDDFITSGFPGSDYPSFSFVSISGYDETVLGDKNQGFTPPTDISDPINPYDGYWCYIGPLPAMVDVTGPANKGDVVFPVSYTDDLSQPASEDGWNMFGNPYPCTIDWDSPNWTKTNMNNAVYIWRADLQNFASYVSGIGTNGGSRYISSSQGIWLQANGPGAALISTENCKAPVDQSYLRVSNTSSGNFFKLEISGNNYADQTAIRFHPLATDTFDYLFDAYKLFDQYSPAPYIATLMDTMDMSINSYPELVTDLTFLIRTRVQSSGTYSISILDIDSMQGSTCIVLKDLLTNIETDLRTDTSYSFYISDTTYAPRFLLFVGAPFQIAKTDVLCNGGNDGQAIAMGTGSPPWDYTWKDGQNTVLQTTNASYGADTLSGLIAGVYSVEISGGGGHCNAVSDTFSIAEPAWINLSLSTGNVLCHAGVDGSVTANAGGGVPPYLYQWSNGETTAAIAGLSAGIYSLTMTDANGCSTTGQALVEEPAELQITTQVTDASQSNCDGMAIASCNGGTGSYSFLWDGNAGNQASATADSLCPGTYYVTVTDQNGCTAIDSAIVVITGLVELNVHGDASVYPNPTGDRCYVQLSGINEGAILLYDPLGQEVLRSEFVNGAHAEYASLDVSALDEGIYYLVIRGDEIVKSARISVIHQRKMD